MPGPFPRPSLARREHARKRRLLRERAAFRDYAATGVSRAGCLIALARGSGIVLFRGLTAKWSNSAIDFAYGRGAQRTFLNRVATRAFSRVNSFLSQKLITVFRIKI